MTAPLLERLGPVPAVRVHLDFETYYSGDYTLRKLTTEAYVRDERFEVLGVGVRVGERPPVWLEEWEFREWAARVDWSRVACNAHHAQFDGLILSERYGIRPGFWFCTLSLGGLLHGERGLELLAQRYGLGGKTEGALAATKGKRRADLTQREWLAFGDYCKRDVELSAALLDRMLPTVPVGEWWTIDTTIRMFTEPVFVANTAVLTEALEGERRKKAELLARVASETGGDARATLASDQKFAALLESLGVAVPMKPGAGGMKPAFAKTDPGMAALLEHERDEIRFLAEARLAVKSTIVETRTERLLGIAQRGRVPFYLKFAGAHTHRWSGGDKMNPQNFNRGGALRDAIEIDDSSELVVADSGQIEARVLPWLAGESRLLETFRRNDAKTLRFEATGEGEAGDFYSDEGSAFFGRKLSKKETPQERQLSKAMILGLGFGMGWGKFGAELLKGLLGTPPVQFVAGDAVKFGVDVAGFGARPFGLEGPPCARKVAELRERNGIRVPLDELLIHFAVTDHLVRLYRAKNSRIAAFWKTCDEILRVMEIPEGSPSQVRLRVRGLEVMRHAIRKPSGLVLRYPGLRRVGGRYVYQGGKSGREWVDTYGGSLTENLVQSLARDIVAEQALEVRAAGLRVATTTHDEIAAVTRRGNGAAALETMIAAMRTPPAWCADLPLNAEGGFGTSYGAIK